MHKFIERVNEIHELIKGGNRESLPIDSISENFLVEQEIIKLENNKIVFLDTKLIGENYLMLWNEDLILCLTELEHLVLENLELRELDLTSLKNLKRIDLISCNRDSLIYIAENQELETFDVSVLKLNDEDVCPVYLYAHPDQVDKVFPKNVEKKCKDKEGYLVVTLYLAPPRHKSVESNDFSFKYLSRFKEAELGLILKEYWNQQPDYYTKYSSLEEAPDHEKEEFSLLLEVEKKVERGFYREKNLSFNPDRDIEYPSLNEREFGKGRTIPECMTQTV